MSTTLTLPRSTGAFLRAWLRDAAQRGLAAWRRRRADAARRRDVAATIAVLRGLDDATLRDLAFHRSEIGSVAAEAGSRLQRRHRGAAPQ